MIANITRTMKWCGYDYVMEKYSEIHAYSPYNYGILPKKITATDKNTMYTISQTNWALKLLTLIPLFWILPIDCFPKYKVFKNGILLGKSSVAFFTPRRKLVIQNHKYEFYLHNDNYVSIMKDDIQIALVKKSILSLAEENNYVIDFENAVECDYTLIILFVAFIDIIFFPNHFRIDAIKYEKTIGIDKYKHRTLWKSESR